MRRLINRFVIASFVVLSALSVVAMVDPNESAAAPFIRPVMPVRPSFVARPLPATPGIGSGQFRTFTSPQLGSGYLGGNPYAAYRLGAQNAYNVGNGINGFGRAGLSFNGYAYRPGFSGYGGYGFGYSGFNPYGFNGYATGLAAMQYGLYGLGGYGGGVGGYGGAGFGYGGGFGGLRTGGYGGVSPGMGLGAFNTLNLNGFTNLNGFNNFSPATKGTGFNGMNGL